MQISSAARQLLHQLEAAGYEAWCVGGCVRDALLGQTPHDWDVCTNARPQQVLAVFAHCRTLCTGLKHGTVTVLLENMAIEVTTYRTEGPYRDGRHPDSVAFVEELVQDLARRDFTVNAIAYHPDRGFVDPFGGMEDLQARCIRCVGDPAARFAEDGLRIVRGLRFAARYDFTIAPATAQAMCDGAQMLQRISPERVCQEVCRLLPHVRAPLMAAFVPVFCSLFPCLRPCVGFVQRNPHHQYDVYAHTAHVVENTPPDVVLRLAALLHDVGKPACATVDAQGVGHFYGHVQHSTELAGQALQALRFDKRTTEAVLTLIRYHDDPLQAEKRCVRRLLNQLGQTQLQKLILLQRADRRAKADADDFEQLDRFEALLAQVLATENCFTLADLAVHGADLLAMGVPEGRQVGQLLQWLLTQVLEGRLPNTRQALCQAAQEQWARM